MNKVILMGRLVADPECSGTRSNVSVCKFRIAVDRAYNKGDEKQSDFLAITTFGKVAEVVDKHFAKGKPILIEGRIQNNNYEDKDGKMQYHNQIIADNVHFLLSDPTRDGRNRSENRDSGSSRYDDDYRRNSRRDEDRDYDREDRDDISDEDLSGYSDIISEDDLPF